MGRKPYSILSRNDKRQIEPGTLPKGRVPFCLSFQLCHGRPFHFQQFTRESSWRMANAPTNSVAGNKE